jgi:hypothetical protein
MGRASGFDGGYREPPPDPPPPPDDATVEEIIEYYGDDDGAMRRELKRRQQKARRRLMAESMVGVDWSADATPETSEASGAEPGADDGRPLKQHPGIALREAARLITTEDRRNDSKVVRDVMQKAREKVHEHELDAHKWKFTWDDAGLMREALVGRPRLAKWTPKDGLQVRKKPSGVFRTVLDFEWLPIPRRS